MRVREYVCLSICLPVRVCVGERERHRVGMSVCVCVSEFVFKCAIFQFSPKSTIEPTVEVVLLVVMLRGVATT